jgi:hypothetical protein
MQAGNPAAVEMQPLEQKFSAEALGFEAHRCPLYFSSDG